MSLQISCHGSQSVVKALSCCCRGHLEVNYVIDGRLNLHTVFIIYVSNHVSNIITAVIIHQAWINLLQPKLLVIYTIPMGQRLSHLKCELMCESFAQITTALKV
jgi:hypothetical protein